MGNFSPREDNLEIFCELSFKYLGDLGNYWNFHRGRRNQLRPARKNFA